MHPAILRFAENLSARPYCSNDHTARYIRQKRLALEYSHVSLNQRRVAYVALDIDEPGAAWAWEAANLPRPTLTMVNPINARGHMLYELDAPVPTSDISRIKTIQFLADVEARICDVMQADSSYNHLMIKNPLHNAWRVIANDVCYDLCQLLEYLPDKKPRPRKQEELPSGWQRHCSLFYQLRHWAYPRAIAARSANIDLWIEACRCQAEKLNTFTNPLPQSSIKATAKSVARWTYFKYAGSALVDPVLTAAAQLGAEHGLSQAEALAIFPGLVAEVAGVSRDTVERVRKLTQA